MLGFVVVRVEVRTLLLTVALVVKCLPMASDMTVARLLLSMRLGWLIGDVMVEIRETLCNLVMMLLMTCLLPGLAKLAAGLHRMTGIVLVEAFGNVWPSRPRVIEELAFPRMKELVDLFLKSWPVFTIITVTRN